ITKWQPAFFMRSHALETGELGAWFAALWGVGGFLGTYCGGEIASRYAASNERLQLKFIAILYCVLGLVYVGVYLSSNKYVALGLLAVAIIGVTSSNGPLFATIQTLVPERMRATAIALILLFANLIGMGLGPLAAGILSDALRPIFANDSLRYAL